MVEITNLRKTNYLAGTSFHNVVITTTLQKLISVLGTPHFNGDGETHFEWDFEFLCNGHTIIATLYDYGEEDFSDDEEIEWHIGGLTKQGTEIFKEYLLQKMEEEKGTKISMKEVEGFASIVNSLIETYCNKYPDEYDFNSVAIGYDENGKIYCANGDDLIDTLEWVNHDIIPDLTKSSF